MHDAAVVVVICALLGPSDSGERSSCFCLPQRRSGGVSRDELVLFICIFYSLIYRHLQCDIRVCAPGMLSVTTVSLPIVEVNCFDGGLMAELPWPRSGHFLNFSHF